MRYNICIKQIKIVYTNYKNKTSERLIEPIELWFGSNKWHPDEQWILKAKDIAKDEIRDFAVVHISGFSKPDLNLADDVGPMIEPSDNGELHVAKLFADGGSRGNPGPSALGYVLLDMEDNVVKKQGSYLGITTNNQAEYQALLAGMKDALDHGVTDLHVYMDSLLVINQVRGIWKIKNADLLPHFTAIRELIPQFEHVSLSHVPRAMNKLADAMVNECLDAQ